MTASPSFTRFISLSFLQMLIALVSQSFGFPCHKRYNLHYLSAGVLLYASGNTVHLLNLNDAIKKVPFYLPYYRI
jgi:hypothetical protein